MNIQNSKYAIKSHFPFNGKDQLNHEREQKKKLIHERGMYCHASWKVKTTKSFNFSDTVVPKSGPPVGEGLDSSCLGLNSQ